MGLAVDRKAGCEALIGEAYFRSIELLRHNSVAEGVLACSPGPRAKERNYDCIFGRDAAICALGMFASREPDLVTVARNGLRTLAQYQGTNGQIPKFVNPHRGEADFWYTGCIDATLWWLIALRLHDRFFPETCLEAELQMNVQRAWHWLLCQEHQGWYLLQQNEASDWADIMPRSGFVLYTNALWYWAKSLYEQPTARATRDFANSIFYPFHPAASEHRRVRLLGEYVRNACQQDDFYLSFVNLSFWGDEIDTFGNVLSALTGLADRSRSDRIASSLVDLGVHRPWPLRVVARPIGENHSLWRPYMQRHGQNFPFQYHNGGSWPFVGGFWVLLLQKLGRDKDAWEELEQLALANRCEDWQFNEWFHGESGVPLGMVGQSWNAALFILACQSLNGKLDFII
ncbi:MAG: glycoside hydrolase 100 family protein [Syntrophotaleaceae bacterium]